MTIPPRLDRRSARPRVAMRSVALLSAAGLAAAGAMAMPTQLLSAAAAANISEIILFYVPSGRAQPPVASFSLQPNALKQITGLSLYVARGKDSPGTPTRLPHSKPAFHCAAATCQSVDGRIPLDGLPNFHRFSLSLYALGAHGPLQRRTTQFRTHRQTAYLGSRAIADLSDVDALAVDRGGREHEVGPSAVTGGLEYVTSRDGPKTVSTPIADSANDDLIRLAPTVDGDGVIAVKATCNSIQAVVAAGNAKSLPTFASGSTIVSTPDCAAIDLSSYLVDVTALPHDQVAVLLSRDPADTAAPAGPTRPTVYVGTLGGSFTATELPTPPVEAQYPTASSFELARDPATGSLYVAITEVVDGSGGSHQTWLWSSSDPAAGGWSQPDRIAYLPTRDYYATTSMIAEDNEIWLTYDRNFGISTVHGAAGGDWSQVEPIDHTSVTDQSAHLVAAPGQRPSELNLLRPEFGPRGAKPGIEVRHLRAGGHWSRPTLLSSYRAGHLHAAMTPDGTIRYAYIRH